MYNGDMKDAERKEFDLQATVGDLFDEIVVTAATIDEEATLADAVEAIIARETTKKAYVIDRAGKLKGTIAMVTLMRHLSYRLGARSPGVISFVKFIREVSSDKVKDFMSKPATLTKSTKIVEVVQKVVENNLNDFPVVDENNKLLGEMSALNLLKATRNVFRTSKSE